MKTITGSEDLVDLCSKLRAAVPEDHWLLPCSALVNLLNRFLAGEVNAKDVEDVADVFEMNEAVEYEQARKQIMVDTIFVLSNPEINAPLTQTHARILIQRLNEQ